MRFFEQRKRFEDNDKHDLRNKFQEYKEIVAGIPSTLKQVERKKLKFVSFFIRKI